MSNVRIYQCFRYYFFLCFSIYFWPIKQFFWVCFFLPIVFKNILTFSLLTRNTILTLALALAFPTGASIIVVTEQRETPLLAPDKINKVLNVVE